MKDASTTLVGKRSIQDKELLLRSGAIFVFHAQGLIYIVSMIYENKEVLYYFEVYAHEEDYVCMYDVAYTSLTLLEAHEPLKIERFNIVYLMPSTASSVPLNDIPMRSDIIQAVVHETGLEWSVDDIRPYTLPEGHHTHWQAWLTTVSRPLYGGMQQATRFVLALYEPQHKSWWVLNPTAIVAPPNTQHLSQVIAAFFVPDKDEIEAWKKDEQSEGKPLL